MTIILYQKNIVVNQALELVVEQEGTANLYHSRIEEVSDTELLLALPYYKGLPVFLQPGTEITGRFIQDGAVFQFRSVYREHRPQPLPVWAVSPAFDIAKVQRRAFYRIETYMPVSMQTDPGACPEDPQAAAVNLQSKDLSGGGIRVISKTMFDPGSGVMLEFSLPGKASIHTRGKVVRSEPSAPDSSIYWVSIEFTDIDEHDRKNIVSFVFKKQLEQR